MTLLESGQPNGLEWRQCRVCGFKAYEGVECERCGEWLCLDCGHGGVCADCAEPDEGDAAELELVAAEERVA